MNNSKELFNTCSEDIYPHSPDVLERETSDNGYSKGWGMHFTPVEKYWFDVHTHILEYNIGDAVDSLKVFFEGLDKLNVGRVVGILPELVRECDAEGYKEERCFTNNQEMLSYLEKIKGIDKLAPMIYINYKNPDAKAVEEAAKLGICGIKLHNAPLMMEAGDPEIWLSEGWTKTFEAIQNCGLPVLFHVTQRLTDCPYTGGGRNTYWKQGWEKGAKFTNEDLLQVYLKVVERFPGINFISAHQLHIGWDRLTQLFDTYPNLYTDTTIGCFVRKDHEIYEADREYLKEKFVNYSDRILFGTDILVGCTRPLWYYDREYEGHMRFIRQLRLPHDVFQKVSWENAERLLKLDR